MQLIAIGPHVTCILVNVDRGHDGRCSALFIQTDWIKLVAHCAVTLKSRHADFSDLFFKLREKKTINMPNLHLS